MFRRNTGWIPSIAVIDDTLEGLTHIAAEEDRRGGRFSPVWFKVGISGFERIARGIPQDLLPRSPSALERIRPHAGHEFQNQLHTLRSHLWTNRPRTRKSAGRLRAGPK